MDVVSLARANFAAHGVVPSYLEMLPLAAYGDSYGAWTNNSYGHWFDTLKARMRLTSNGVSPPRYYNSCVSGFLAADAAAFAFGSFTATCQGLQNLVTNAVAQAGTAGAASGGVVVLHIGRNDAGYDGRVGTGGTSAKAQAGFTNGLDALIRVLRAKSRVENTTASFSSGWTSLTGQSGTSGNTISYTTTAGATATYTLTVPGSSSVPCSLVVLGLDDDEMAITGAAYSVTVDGGTAITGTTSQQMKRTFTAVRDAKYVQLCIPLGLLAPGSHTVVLTHAGSTGQYLYSDCALVGRADPPTVIVTKLPQVPAAGYATYAASASWTKDQTYLALYDTVAARFPADGSVVVADPNSLGWDPATMVGNTDGASLHANDLGNSFYADMYTQVLQGLTPREGLIKLA